IGPGLAHAPGTDDFVIAVLRNARSTPTVVDADGLNALARTEGWRELLPTKTILTPHDGEAARLAGRVVPAGAARFTFAERHARDWGAILVLKGPVTVVSDGRRPMCTISQTQRLASADQATLWAAQSRRFWPAGSFRWQPRRRRSGCTGALAG